ncbi:MAG: aminotransferase class IV [Archangium sp.]|nr:aminotransferase class IV [Archangium sp.]
MTALWLDGALRSMESSPLGILTHSLHYGTAVFDGCRFYRLPDGTLGAFRLRDHLKRLAAGARSAFLELPYSEEQLVEGCRAVVRASGLDGGYLRQLVFFGDDEVGIGGKNATRVAIMTWSRKSAPKPVRLRVAGFGHGAGWLPGTKLAGAYARSFLARREAERTGSDDAVFLGPDGTISEATAANVFAVVRGTLVTPPSWAPILRGITRESVLTLAAEAKIPCVEAPLRRDDLASASEAFLCSSAGEVNPIAAFEGRSFPAPGPVTAELMRLFAGVAGGADGVRRGWLEPM